MDTFHVAPHGWIRASHQLELSGRLFTRGAGTVRDDSDGAFSDPVLRSYLATSLVVSSDALAAAGWSARRTNEEAVIDSAGEGWWSSLTARRRQDVSLAASGGVRSGRGRVRCGCGSLVEPQRSRLNERLSGRRANAEWPRGRSAHRRATRSA